MMLESSKPEHARMPKEQADREYFRRRAEQELDNAQRCDHPEVVRLHYQLANLYLELIYNGQAYETWLKRSDMEWAALGQPAAGPVMNDIREPS